MIMNLNNKKILLVGGCGFIGHNLALKLKSYGAEVTIIDGLNVNNLFSITQDNVKNKKIFSSIINSRINLINNSNINFIIQDARDYHSMSRHIKDLEPDILIHLAAVSHANRSNKDPHSTFDHSLRTLENSLDIARNFKSHFIYFSSSMVYGNFLSNEVGEESLCKPIGIYGALKYSGEKIVEAYNQVFDLPFTIIRPSALYGERCVSRRVGQIFIENAIQNLDITIEGDGEDTLDFTYIDDLIQGVVKCCIDKNAINQIFNITYGNSRKIVELLEILESEFSNLKINFKSKDKFMPKRGTLNIDKAKNLIKYNPEYPIEKGYREYIRWYKNFWNSINDK
jgi:nucleoside-diphosphate-sugar epimerase